MHAIQSITHVKEIGSDLTWIEVNPFIDRKANCI